jgi:hypothetical protein
MRRFAIVVVTIVVTGGGSVISAGLAQAATFSVACGDVYGPEGLVDAINDANAGSGPNKIVLAEDCTYKLTSIDNGTFANGDNGLPVIASRLTIKGHGSTIKRGSPTPLFRIFDVGGTGNLVLQDLTITGGEAGSGHGGGILNESSGTLALDNTNVSGNVAVATKGTARGGGIFNDSGGTVRLTHSQVSGNTATASTTLAAGAGIFNLGMLTLTDSGVRDNTASAPGHTAQGAGISTDGGPLTIKRSHVTDNTARAPGGAAAGGGIFKAGGIVTLAASVITQNNPDNCSPPGSVPGCHN